MFPDYVEWACYIGAIAYLVIHFKMQADYLVLFFVGALVCATGLLFILVSQDRYPVRLSILISILVLFGTMLFVILSECLLRGLAKYLTEKCGEK